MKELQSVPWCTCLFLTWGSTVKKITLCLWKLLRREGKAGAFLGVANKGLAPCVQPNHDPLLATTDSFSKLNCHECPWVKQRWWPWCCHFTCPSGFLAPLSWREFLWTQKSVWVLWVFLHRWQVRNNCDLVSKLGLICAQRGKAQERFQNVLWSLLGRNSWNICLCNQQAALILWAKTQAESQ